MQLICWKAGSQWNDVVKKDKCYALKKRLTAGLGGRWLGTGRCPVVPHRSGPIWETTSIVFIIYICILLKIHGDYRQDAGMAKGVPRLTVTELEWGCLEPHMLMVSPYIRRGKARSQSSQQIGVDGSQGKATASCVGISFGYTFVIATDAQKC